MGLSQRAGEVLWGYRSMLKHRVKGSCGAEQREEVCTPPHTEDVKCDVTSHLFTPWEVPGRQNPSLGSPGASCCWKKSLESQAFLYRVWTQVATDIQHTAHFV